MLKKGVLITATLLTTLLCGCNGQGDEDYNDNGSSPSYNHDDTSGSTVITPSSGTIAGTPIKTENGDALLVTPQQILEAGVLKDANYVVKDDLKIKQNNSVTIKDSSTLTIK
ncbi:hypothetical protein [Photobacterium leiognathi]|uniref:hypothetical protein n=1 Tax=Photobacterium leiognathi TaxID=553611 RepID=UPI0029816A0A|nr:hypothetical protein [Photobacterium leiognathi]